MIEPTNLKEDIGGIEELKNELRSLSDIIVVQTINNMIKHYEEDEEEDFLRLLEKVRRYKNGFIVSEFLKKKKKMVDKSPSPHKINMLSLAENALDINII